MGEREHPKMAPQYDLKHVRMGMWVDEFSNDKRKIAVLRKGRKERKLNLQIGISPLFEQLLSSVMLKSSEGLLKYGDVIQFVCQGQVLSIMTKNKDYSIYETIPQGAILTASDITEPCVRNSFLIANPWKNIAEGEIVNYGDDFAISTIDSPQVPKLYATADYPFGTLTLKPGHSLLRMTSYPDNHCRLKIERTVDTEMSEGYAVISTEPLFLKSSATNRDLVVNKKFTTLSVLGMEKEVTFYYTPDWFTKYDEANLTNIWRINSANVVS